MTQPGGTTCNSPSLLTLRKQHSKGGSDLAKLFIGFGDEDQGPKLGFPGCRALGFPPFSVDQKWREKGMRLCPHWVVLSGAKALQAFSFH